MLINFIRFLLYLCRKFWPRAACCRFYPSCSHYAEEALVRYGAFHGSFLALKRLIRCNPFVPGGYDPVP